MNPGNVSKEIAAGWMALKQRIAAAKIPWLQVKTDGFKLDEIIQG